MGKSKRDKVPEALQGLEPVFEPLDATAEWATGVIEDVDTDQLEAVIRVVADAVYEASDDAVAEQNDALLALDLEYAARVTNRRRSLIWAMAQRHPTNDVLVRLAELEVEKRWWKGAVEAFDRMTDIPTSSVSSYCAALIHCGRPDDVRALLDRHGVDGERGRDWYRIATTTEPAASASCLCDGFEGTELPRHPALKDVLWFTDDCYDDNWAFCLDCHTLWNGGNVQGELAPWKRAEPADMDHEGLWTCGFGGSAHPGSEIFQNHDRFVRWVVELPEPEQAFTLP